MKDDQETWQQAVLKFTSQYVEMAQDLRTELDQTITRIMQIKEQILEMTLSAGGDSICRTCGGECCRNGKYHFTILDLLAYRQSGLDPVEARFTEGTCCPYSGKNGCLMPPRFRPMTCVVFNCEQIEAGMEKTELMRLYECEQQLRESIGQASRIAGYRLERPLLLGI